MLYEVITLHLQAPAVLEIHAAAAILQAVAGHVVERAVRDAGVDAGSEAGVAILDHVEEVCRPAAAVQRILV